MTVPGNFILSDMGTLDIEIGDFDYRVYQQGNGLWFEATNVVPVPGAALLGLLGLSSSGWLIRRRRHEAQA